MFALLLAAMAPGFAAAAGQASQYPASSGIARPSTTATPSASRASSASAVPGDEGTPDNGSAEEQPAHIAIATPAPAPSPWPWQDRIAWAANLVLVVLGYAGILLALSVLRKIEQQMQYAEAAAQAATESAQTVLIHAKAIERAERPWILVTAEPSRRVENRFILTATNRGRGPARILSSVEMITVERDQGSLPAEPSYEEAEQNPSLNGVILLPGESTPIKIFGRDDLRRVCGTEERLRRVERWEEEIFLYGQIIYENLIATSDLPAHETGWCCGYIHGAQNSGMEMTGPPAYNRHT